MLRALGRGTELAQSSLRLSFGRFTTAADIDAAADAIRREVSRLRVLAGGEAVPGAAAGLDRVLAGSLLARSLTPQAARHFLAPARAPQRAPGDALAMGRGAAGQAAQGTRVNFELEIAAGFVKNARFTAYGCPHTLAVADGLCEVLQGARIDAGIPGTPAEWAEKFVVPIEKLGRLLIVEDALRAAFASARQELNDHGHFAHSRRG